MNVFQSEGEDELKKRQLMELAIINGTYRDSQSKNASRKFIPLLPTREPLLKGKANVCR